MRAGPGQFTKSVHLHCVYVHLLDRSVCMVALVLCAMLIWVDPDWLPAPGAIRELQLAPDSPFQHCHLPPNWPCNNG